jgi:hypothetical protein
MTRKHSPVVPQLVFDDLYSFTKDERGFFGRLYVLLKKEK